MKSFRDLLKNRTPLLGTFLQLPSPEITEIFGFCGYDFVIIDNEHSTIGPEISLAMVRAAEASGTCAIIRTPDCSETNIKKALDTGAKAVLCPGIQSVDDVKDVLRFAKYAPHGMRGACPGVRANQYGEKGLDYYQQANEQTAVLVQIEGKDACLQIDEILQLNGLDGILLGPVDLSMSLGHPGEVTHPEVVAAMNNIFQKAKEQHIAVAAFAMDYDTAKMWLDKGIDILAYHIDSMMIRECASSIKRRINL